MPLMLRPKAVAACMHIPTICSRRHAPAGVGGPAALSQPAGHPLPPVANARERCTRSSAGSGSGLGQRGFEQRLETLVAVFGEG